MLGVVLTISACHEPTPTSPSAPVRASLSGTWTGTLSEGSADQGRLELSLRETALAPGLTLLSGVWRITFADPSRTSSGVVTGGASGAVITLNLDPSFPVSCAPAVLPNAIHANGFVLNLAWAGNRLAGRSIYYTCTDAVDGTVDLGR